MGGGNGSKAAMKRERNAKEASKEPKSQLKVVSLELHPFSVHLNRRELF